MATYYRYFRAGGNYLLLTALLIVFLMGEVWMCHCVCAVADLGGVRGVQMHPPLAASYIYLLT